MSSIYEANREAANESLTVGELREALAKFSDDDRIVSTGVAGAAPIRHLQKGRGPDKGILFANSRSPKARRDLIDKLNGKAVGS